MIQLLMHNRTQFHVFTNCMQSIDKMLGKSFRHGAADKVIIFNKRQDNPINMMALVDRDSRQFNTQTESLMT